MDCQTKKLGELAQIEIGRTPSRADKSLWDIEKVTNNTWLSIADLLNSKNNFIFESKEYISDKAIEQSKIVLKGTLLVSFKLTLGRLAFAGKDLYTNEAIAALNIKNNQVVSSIFLFYFLTFFDWNLAAKNDVKIKGKTLNKAKLNEILVSYPSISEQEKIVKILDQVFEKIEKAKENAEKNLQNSRELFESFLQGISSSTNGNWLSKSIMDVTSKVGSGATPLGGQNSYKNSGVSLIRSLNVHDGSFRLKNLAYIDEKQAQKLSNVRVEKEDILLNITGASIARCCIVPEDVLPARVNQHVSIVRVKDNTILPELLQYLLISKTYKNKLLGIGEKGGSTRQALTKKLIEDFVIRYPDSLSEQSRLIKKIKDMSIQTKKLEEVYRQKLLDLEELKKSVLEKAFAGEL